MDLDLPLAIISSVDLFNVNKTVSSYIKYLNIILLPLNVQLYVSKLLIYVDWNFIYLAYTQPSFQYPVSILTVYIY